MPAFKRILVPFDWSEESNCAFQLAASLARHYRSRLDVLYVVPLPVVMYGPPPESYADRLREKLCRLQPSDPTIAIRHLLAEGDPAAVILRTAKETSCDAIVMGTHGRTGLGRLLLGSVAKEVIRKAPCSVLTVGGGIPAERVASPCQETVVQRTATGGTDALD